MGCFSCVQDCTKNLLRLSINPEYEKLGNSYWTPEIIQTTWLQAETAKIPVSGAGYGGKFSGYGFDSMWTDMSEIVRPTRDGIHGREYISTAVDIGQKAVLPGPRGDEVVSPLAPILSMPMPLIIDMLPGKFALPEARCLHRGDRGEDGPDRHHGFARNWPLFGKNAESICRISRFYFAAGAACFPRRC